MRGLLTKAITGLFGPVASYWAQGPAKLTDPVLGRWWGEGRSYSGKSVTIDTALQVETLWAVVTLIAGSVATLPCNVFRNAPDGRRIAREHPLYILLHDSPSADLTAVEFWELVMAGLLLWGNAYVEIQRGFRGSVVALVPLSPALVSVRRDDNGVLVYTVTEDGKKRDIPEEDCLHIRGFSLDGVTGLSPIRQAAHSLGLAMAADETAGSLMANGLRTPGYIASPGPVGKDRRQDAREYIEGFAGARNAGRIPFLESGWEFKAFTLPPQEAELLATRAFSVESICRFYRVPPHMVGHTEKSTSWGSGLEAQMLGFLTLTLRPWLKRIESAAKRKLIPAAERGTLEIEFNATALLRGDSAARAAYYTAMIQNGIYTRDEVRGLENLPLMGGAAATLMAQAQHVPIDAPAPAAKPAAPARASVAESEREP